MGFVVNVYLVHRYWISNIPVGLYSELMDIGHSRRFVQRVSSLYIDSGNTDKFYWVTALVLRGVIVKAAPKSKLLVIPVHCTCTRSPSVISRLLGMKSYSTAGIVCCRLPRFPRTFRL